MEEADGRFLTKFAPRSGPPQLWLVLAALAGGIGVAMIATLLGATVQAIYAYPDGRETERRVARDGSATRFLRGWPWLTNDLVNLLSSIAGALIAVAVATLLGP